MKLAINNTLLSHLSNGINKNPRLALLLANEYMGPKDPLRLALVSKGRRCGFRGDNEIDKKIELGETRESLGLDNSKLGTLSPVKKFRFRPQMGGLEKRREARGAEILKNFSRLTPKLNALGR